MQAQCSSLNQKNSSSEPSDSITSTFFTVRLDCSKVCSLGQFLFTLPCFSVRKLTGPTPFLLSIGLFAFWSSFYNAVFVLVWQFEADKRETELLLLAIVELFIVAFDLILDFMQSSKLVTFYLLDELLIVTLNLVLLANPR